MLKRRSPYEGGREYDEWNRRSEFEREHAQRDERQRTPREDHNRIPGMRETARQACAQQ